MGDAKRPVNAKVAWLFAMAVGMAAFFSAGAGWAAEVIAFPAFPHLRFASDNIIPLPPGDVSGRASRPDGQPFAAVRVALFDPESGEEVAAAQTGDDGEFAFPELAEGRYVVVFGVPGIYGILDVKEGAAPGTLNLTVPSAALLPVGASQPAWQGLGLGMGLPGTGGYFQGAGGVGAVFVGATVLTGMLIINEEVVRRRDRTDVVISPIIP